MKCLSPLTELAREAILPRLIRLVRLHASHIRPLAPSDMHLKQALRLANLERRS